MNSCATTFVSCSPGRSDGRTRRTASAIEAQVGPMMPASRARARARAVGHQQGSRAVRLVFEGARGGSILRSAREHRGQLGAARRDHRRVLCRRSARCRPFRPSDSLQIKGGAESRYSIGVLAKAQAQPGSSLPALARRAHWLEDAAAGCRAAVGRGRRLTNDPLRIIPTRYFLSTACEAACRSDS